MPLVTAAIANGPVAQRHQRQLLLLLFHAAKCRHERGPCLTTPHCPTMKKLWKQVAKGKNSVPVSCSSRWGCVLRHYYNCHDATCPVCVPVRATMRRARHGHLSKVKKQKCFHVLEVLQQQHPLAWIFDAPVDPVALEMPDYFQVIENPMDLGTIRERVENDTYHDNLQEFVKHVHLTFDNAMLYNAEGSVVYNAAKEMKETFEQVWRNLTLDDNNGLSCPVCVPPVRAAMRRTRHCHRPQEIKKQKCLRVLEVLQQHPFAWMFDMPVDPVELGLPDYYQVIESPMDLGTIREKVKNGTYHDNLEKFVQHVHLTFDNAILYNAEGSVVYNAAKEIKEMFEQVWMIF